MAGKPFKSILLICVCCALLLPAIPARAFALLGPFESWMQSSNDFSPAFDYWYVSPGHIGGPMCISNGYRWNVPVVTYGFDQSFLNFFGTNGVAAVEGAIQILNDLPPASGVVLTNYPDFSQQINAQAQSQSLYDLKSVTLSLLLEQTGLASPTRSIFVLRKWNPIFMEYGSWTLWPEGIIPQYVVRRNFDPSSLAVSDNVNGFEYGGEIIAGFALNVNIAISEPVENFVNTNPVAMPYPAVADNFWYYGGLFYTGLTADDVGALCYLFSTNNVNYENLLPGVSGVGANATSWVNGAWRPGINKITFVRQPCGSSAGVFLPMTNQFTDTYITNGVVMQQQVQRVITQPDFLFNCGDTGQDIPAIMPYSRTGTSNWVNNAALNGRASIAGPGVIQPPVKITFANLGEDLFTPYPDEQTAYAYSSSWATYDDSTNAPLVYPQPRPGTNQLNVRLWLAYNPVAVVPYGRNVELSLTAQTGKVFLLQTSSNLTDWVSLGTNQVNGSVWTLFDRIPMSSARFYRIVPQ